jgi:hypothetical protein
MNQYVLLYRGAERPTSPQETQTIMQKWMTWLEELGRNGRLKDRGQPHEPTGKVVTGKQKTVTDGPFAEAKDLVGGFSIVEAEDLAHAAELAKGCPIFERNGYVEVRPIMKM